MEIHLKNYIWFYILSVIFFSESCQDSLQNDLLARGKDTFNFFNNHNQYPILSDDSITTNLAIDATSPSKTTDSTEERTTITISTANDSLTDQLASETQNLTTEDSFTDQPALTPTTNDDSFTDQPASTPTTNDSFTDQSASTPTTNGSFTDQSASTPTTNDPITDQSASETETLTTEDSSTDQSASITESSSPPTQITSTKQTVSSTKSSPTTTEITSTKVSPTTTDITSTKVLPTTTEITSTKVSPTPTPKPPMPKGIVALIVIGVILLIGFLIGLVYYLMKKRQRSEYTQPLNP